LRGGRISWASTSKSAWSRTGVEDLTCAAASAFNAEVADVDVYGCVLTSSATLHPLLAPTHRWLRERAGDNDGIVSKRSQVWGEVVAAMPITGPGRLVGSLRCTPLVRRRRTRAARARF
jgi:hypothetical protein